MQAWLSEEQTHSYLKISRDCHRGMLKAEIDLDSEMIEMVDRVCKKVMKDFEREDRRLVLDDEVIVMCLSGKASSSSLVVACYFFPLLTLLVVVQLNVIVQTISVFFCLSVCLCCSVAAKIW